MEAVRLSLLLVLSPSDGFLPGSPVFVPPQKLKLVNSNSIWSVSPISKPFSHARSLTHLFIYLFIYLFIWCIYLFIYLFIY